MPEFVNNPERPKWVKRRNVSKMKRIIAHLKKADEMMKELNVIFAVNPGVGHLIGNEAFAYEKDVSIPQEGVLYTLPDMNVDIEDYTWYSWKEEHPKRTRVKKV